ncbi:MAG: insulinase family protein, partial [Duncaniella sp.]|nr:insulinase family protein [Duncaniella sp.]
AVNSFEYNQRITMQHYLPRAQELAMAEMQGEDINGRIDAYRAVTTGDITAAARDILDPSHACTLIYLPEQQ